MKKRIMYLGEPAEGEIIDFQAVVEGWCEYALADGTRLRIRLIVKEVIKVPGEFSANGEPVYLVLSDNIISQAVPEELKQRRLALVPPLGGPPN